METDPVTAIPAVVLGGPRSLGGEPLANAVVERLAESWLRGHARSL
jgi:hypothetical protein